jgi:hypothetical protein
LSIKIKRTLTSLLCREHRAMARGSHGDQQLSLFNAHYDERCFLPIRVYDTDRSRPVAVVLRPGKTPSGVEVRAYLLRLTQHIRNRWPKGRAAVHDLAGPAKKTRTICTTATAVLLAGNRTKARLRSWENQR